MQKGGRRSIHAASFRRRSLHIFARHNSFLCCQLSSFEFLQMSLGQIRLIQLPIEICQEKMNLGIAGAEFRQSQGLFSFKCGSLEISLMV